MKSENVHELKQECSSEECFRKLTALVDEHVGGATRWYMSHSKTPLYWFRTFGTFLILLSVSLPVVASSPSFAGKDLTVSLMSLAVALLSAVATFFHWHETWRVNAQSLMELEHLLALWKVKMVAAEQVADAAGRAKAAVLATEELFAGAARVDKANAQGFFKNVQMPSIKK